MGIISAPSEARAKTQWTATGSSTNPDARSAGAEVASAALSADDGKLLVVFSSETYDLPNLLAGVHEVAGEVPVIGCTTAGEIAAAGPGTAGVVAMAIGGRGLTCGLLRPAPRRGSARPAPRWQ